jgi:Phage integrase family/Arm DNA-binding domain
VKLTTNVVAALTMPAGKADHVEWDSDLPGFGVRLRGNSKSWIIQYRIGQQQRKESLGDTRKVTLDAARKIARQRFAQAELGADPVAEGAHRRQVVTRPACGGAAMVPDNFLQPGGDLFALQVTDRSAGDGRPMRPQQVQLGLGIGPRAALPCIDLLRLVFEVKRGDSGDGQLLGLCSPREGLCERNPVIGTNDPTEGDKPRDRVLEDSELATVWNSCADDDFGRIVRLLILTGCRREEIGGLRWGEIDFATGTMTIPGERTKNYRALKLTLPQQALDILQSVEPRDGRDFVFGGRGGAYCAWSYATNALHLRIATNGKPLARWTLHDLRRTMRTGLSMLGVPPHVAELCINHARKNSVEATYDRYAYGKEIADALARWADHVGDVVEGRKAKVVPLRA